MGSPLEGQKSVIGFHPTRPFLDTSKEERFFEKLVKLFIIFIFSKIIFIL